MSPQEILDAARTNPDLARRLPSATAHTQPSGQADQGARGPDRSDRSSRTQLLHGKTAEEIREMTRRGDLDHLLRGDDQ